MQSTEDDLGSRVRRYLRRQGGDLSEYVNAAIKRQLFWDSMDAVQARNQDLSPEEAEALADAALDWAREGENFCCRGGHRRLTAGR